jgi:hypothetical protein
MKLVTTPMLLLRKLFDFEFLRFLICGFTTTVFSYLLYIILLFAIDYKYAYTLSFIFSILFSYFINTYVVFRKKFDRKKLIKFPLLYIIQYLLGLMLTIWFVSYCNFSAYLAPLIVVILTIPLNFIIVRFFLR